MVSPEIERDRSGQPDPSTGKAASRYRDTASGSGRFRGSYRWHVTEGLDGNKGDPSGSGVSPDKPPRQGRSDGRAEVRPVDSTRRTGEPGGSGWRQMTRSGATRAPYKGSDSPLCKERMKLTVETNLERIAAKCCESSVEERGAGHRRCSEAKTARHVLCEPGAGDRSR